MLSREGITVFLPLFIFSPISQGLISIIWILYPYCSWSVLVRIRYETLNARQLKGKSTKLKPKVLYIVTCNINPTIAIQRGKVHAYATHDESSTIVSSFFPCFVLFTNEHIECGKSPNVVRTLCVLSNFRLCGCYQRDAIILFAFSAASHVYYTTLWRLQPIRLRRRRRRTTIKIYEYFSFYSIHFWLLLWHSIHSVMLQAFKHSTIALYTERNCVACYC